MQPLLVKETDDNVVGCGNVWEGLEVYRKKDKTFFLGVKNINFSDVDNYESKWWPTYPRLIYMSHIFLHRFINLLFWLLSIEQTHGLQIQMYGQLGERDVFM